MATARLHYKANENADKDAKNYRANDSGCLKATLYLGEQSNCLINCPFKICVHDCNTTTKVRKYLMNIYKSIA